MKIINYLMLIATLGVLFTSCAKDEDQFGEAALELNVENRSSGPCNVCENLLSFDVIKLDEKDGCCTFEIQTELSNPCDRIVVEIDGEVKFVSHWDEKNYTFEVCDENDHLIEAFGVDDAGEWKKICDSRTVNCSCGCRRGGVKITELSPDLKGCCRYNIQASGDGKCSTGLSVGGERFDISNISFSKNFTVCPGDELAVQLTKGGAVCFTDTLECEGCCDGVSVDLESLGSPNNSECCEYRAHVYNSSDCELYFFLPSGIIGVTIPPTSNTSIPLRHCPSDGFAVTYRVGTSIDNICDEITTTLLCKEQDCCDGVNATSISLGNIDNDSCCEFRVDIQNPTECSMNIYSPSGAVVGTVSPGANTSLFLDHCPDDGMLGTYRVGEGIDNICTTFTMTAVCKHG